MSFRDDDVATRARADALAEEVAQLKQERDALVAEKEAAAVAKADVARKPKKRKGAPKPAAEDDASASGPSSAWPGRGWSLRELLPDWTRANVIFFVFVALVVALPVVLGLREARRTERARTAYQEAVAKREALRRRWSALVGTEPCSRMVTFEAIWARDFIATAAHRKAPSRVVSVFRSLRANCLAAPKTLAADAEIPAVARERLAAWLAAEARLDAPAMRFGEYYGNDDWREDDHRSGEEQWRALVPLLDARDRALDELRRDAFPLLRESMRAMVRAELAKSASSPVGPRFEVGLLLWEAGERATARARALDEPAAREALKASALAVLARAQGALPSRSAGTCGASRLTSSPRPRARPCRSSTCSSSHTPRPTCSRRREARRRGSRRSRRAPRTTTEEPRPELDGWFGVEGRGSYSIFRRSFSPPVPRSSSSAARTASACSRQAPSYRPPLR